MSTYHPMFLRPFEPETLKRNLVTEQGLAVDMHDFILQKKNGTSSMREDVALNHYDDLNLDPNDLTPIETFPSMETQLDRVQKLRQMKRDLEARAAAEEQAKLTRPLQDKINELSRQLEERTKSE